MIAVISGCATPSSDLMIGEGDIAVKPQAFNITKMGVGDTVKGKITIINNSDIDKKYQCYYHRRNVTVDGWIEMPAEYADWLVFPKGELSVKADGMEQIEVGISIPPKTKMFSKKWWVEIGIGEVSEDNVQGGVAVTLWVTMR